jgi:hypothetical protein
MGLVRFALALQEHFPRLQFGYFNPPKERFRAWLGEAAGETEAEDGSIGGARGAAGPAAPADSEERRQER